jgi:hypothetical protein
MSYKTRNLVKNISIFFQAKTVLVMWHLSGLQKPRSKVAGLCSNRSALNQGTGGDESHAAA